jgi:hypothetical protein
VSSPCAVQGLLLVLSGAPDAGIGSEVSKQGVAVRCFADQPETIAHPPGGIELLRSRRREDGRDRRDSTRATWTESSERTGPEGTVVEEV